MTIRTAYSFDDLLCWLDFHSWRYLSSQLRRCKCCNRWELRHVNDCCGTWYWDLWR